MAIVSSNIENSQSPKLLGKERLTDPSSLIEDLVPFERESFRPERFQDFIGQSELKEILDISVTAALSRQEALDHVLLFGPPGLGKTTMALVLARELGVNCRIASAPALERPRDIIGLLVNLKPREVLFIDEIHRLTSVAEELLYPAMEDKRLELTVGKGTTSKMRTIDLPEFTLVGATTRPAQLSSPLRDRFGLSQRFDFYNNDDLQNIVKRGAQLLKFNLSDSSSFEIAKRSRGTPRIANRLLRRIRDFATVKNQLEVVDISLVNEALKIHRVDHIGLDESDRRLLELLVNVYGGGPVGLDTLSAALGEDAATVEAVIEPFLLQIGFLKRTPRGRVVTPAGQKHLEFNK
ncbi:Holliday junction branch migration DNA helicase RuvB [Prochlorococcus sp. MIT 1223]|uniref:Holliday junction branch migration DNA helicase RuvB n=1 Tax=Prochlorococcus sp. MIT 1223 TaxID=3096217 RepID=UPI002A758ED0|nr:Holliday junction branch migration DNA helicase RuvB [Prochlorococcus sp. MIT 1223]